VLNCGSTSAAVHASAPAAAAAVLQAAPGLNVFLHATLQQQKLNRKHEVAKCSQHEVARPHLPLPLKGNVLQNTSHPPCGMQGPLLHVSDSCLNCWQPCPEHRLGSSSCSPQRASAVASTYVLGWEPTSMPASTATSCQPSVCASPLPSADQRAMNSIQTTLLEQPLFKPYRHVCTYAVRTRHGLPKFALLLLNTDRIEYICCYCSPGTHSRRLVTCCGHHKPAPDGSPAGTPAAAAAASSANCMSCILAVMLAGRSSSDRSNSLLLCL
jgi:hypothetical protein